MTSLRRQYAHTYQQLSKIERSAVRLLWADDFYDGPLTGIALYQGKKQCFEIFAATVQEYRGLEDESEST